MNNNYFVTKNKILADKKNDPEGKNPYKPPKIISKKQFVSIFVVLIILASVVFVVAFSDTIFGPDSKDDNDKLPDDNNNTSDNQTEFKPNIKTVLTASNIQGTSYTTSDSFAQGNSFYVWYEFENATHNNIMNITEEITIKSNNKIYYNNESEYYKNTSDNSFFMYKIISTDKNWTAGEYTLTVKIFDKINNKYSSKSTNFTILGLGSGDNGDTTENDNLEMFNLLTASDIDGNSYTQSSSFEQGDYFIIWYEFKNVTHNSLVDISEEIDVKKGSVSEYNHDEDYSFSTTNNYFYQTVNISTDQTWDAGTYTVNLTLTDNDNNKKAYGEIDFELTQAASKNPTVQIDASPESGETPLTVTFIGTGTDFTGDKTYLWDFGDGNTSATKNDIHTYSDADTYTVTLTINDSYGNSESDSVDIVVTEASNGGTEFDATIISCSNSGLVVECEGNASGGSGSYSYSWEFYNFSHVNTPLIATESGYSVAHDFSSYTNSDLSLKILLKVTDIVDSEEVSDTTYLFINI